jgi:osmotically-inducible protein OsmY
MKRTIITLACVLAAAGCSSTKKNEYGQGGDLAQPYQPASVSSESSTGTDVSITRSAPSNFDRDSGLSDSDRRLADDIRRKIEEGDFSSTTRNLTVNVRDGRVTLNGTTQTMTERELVLRIAREQAGFDNVENQLQVAGRR